MNNESHFGRFAPLNSPYQDYFEERLWPADYDEYFASGLQIMSDGWDRFRLADDTLSPWEEAFTRRYNLGSFLFRQLAMVTVADGMPESALLELWQNLRLAFTPPLGDADQMYFEYADSHEGDLMQDLILELYANEKMVAFKRSLNRICFSPFRDDELTWLLANCPNIVEMGGGRMYFADWYRRNGGNVVSIDNNGYGYLTQGTMPPWMLNFIRSGNYVMGGVEQLAQHCNGRALLIAAPEPGSSFPEESLETFADNGGKTFILKIGGFLGGSPDSLTDYTQPENFLQNKLGFFRTLARRWRQISATPFLPKFMASNMLVFELRS
jgi:hypothetical protein